MCFVSLSVLLSLSLWYTQIHSHIFSKLFRNRVIEIYCGCIADKDDNVLYFSDFTGSASSNTCFMSLFYTSVVDIVDIIHLFDQLLWTIFLQHNQCTGHYSNPSCTCLLYNHDRFQNLREYLLFCQVYKDIDLG